MDGRATFVSPERAVFTIVAHRSAFGGPVDGRGTFVSRHKAFFTKVRHASTDRTVLGRLENFCENSCKTFHKNYPAIQEGPENGRLTR